MKLVRLHTRIPVPEVYNVYKDDESGSRPHRHGIC